MSKLAIDGGSPVRDTYLAYGRQYIDNKDIEVVVELLKGDYLTTGPTVSEFENKVANYVGAKYGVAVSNGTAALHMACHAAGIGPGDEVLVPAITFAASSNCVLYCGGTPIFVDIDPKTYNIDVNKIEDKITEKTKAIIPVDFSGQAVDMDKILEIAEKYNLIVIEDAAHALGGEYKNRKIGTKAHMTEFSFHPVKPVTTAEGGIIVTNDKDLYEKMILFRSHGITRNKNLMSDYHGPWYYEQIDLGYNYRLTDLQCALGISQMDKIDSFIKRRREIVALYNEAFKKLEEINIPFEEEFSNSGWHIYVITLNLDKLKVGRKEVFEALQKENIGVNVHYLPVYLHPYYTKLGYEKGLCPAAEDIYNRMITIPLFPAMTDRDVEDVISAIKKVINNYKI
ncbi:UDP-4-amino-4,6-dideoxy-N-acetyl-beta-L-altrosamine transaminase [Clostridium sp. Sa3CUN1]|uniref:UDP-4-amino-4, 6-dideoxy-N-acetyl-beta-L-altrosamine transaminase n=1 Tax=Clostridium gallinarum TaxID=2762246 RepID=A0ABR8Q5E5_9CLOT|nr:UDP-4-amino-4,6-dideoxy-N-acetyl-beta-L-altrosamine transaminase [Clostridium gallinarum]MBD7915651.1 UDP-4-amino-4,6-dideoxy-N-acetyl-beta-L-altrosamine transaminase [Clostridium gallinarum]